MRAVWRVDGELSRGAVALRSVDDDEFLRRAAFERTGENELVMLDSLPEEFVRVRYVLAGDEQGRLVSLSDTLVSQQGRDEPGVVRGIRRGRKEGTESGSSRLSIDLGGTPQGLHFVRARTADGRTAGTRFVRLRGQRLERCPAPGSSSSTSASIFHTLRRPSRSPRESTETQRACASV